jgi:hypothetical protein
LLLKNRVTGAQIEQLYRQAVSLGSQKRLPLLSTLFGLKYSSRNRLVMCSSQLHIVYPNAKHADERMSS